MLKVRETQTQDHLREKVTRLNLADYLYGLELGYHQGDRRARQPEDHGRPQQDRTSAAL